MAAEGEHYWDNFTGFYQSWLLMRGNDWERVRASKGIQLFLNVLLTWQEKKKKKQSTSVTLHWPLLLGCRYSLSPLSLSLSLTHTAADNAVCFGFNEKSSDSHSTRQAAVWQQNKWALIPQQTNLKKGMEIMKMIKTQLIQSRFCLWCWLTKYKLKSLKKKEVYNNKFWVFFLVLK